MCLNMGYSSSHANPNKLSHSKVSQHSQYRASSPLNHTALALESGVAQEEGVRPAWWI